MNSLKSAIQLVNTHTLTTIVLFFSLAGSLSLAKAANHFNLNFEPVPGADFINSGGGGYLTFGQPFNCPNAANPDCLIGGVVANTFGGQEPAETDPDTSIFINERIGDNVSGYWHLIISDPSQGFAQEVYIPLVRFFRSTSGGKEPIFFRLTGNLEQQSGNGWDPLEFNQNTFGSDNTDFSGNGTGDPTQVMVRQLLGKGQLTAGTARVRDWICDPGEFCQEFLKSEARYKPKITQQFDEEAAISYFELDMSNLDYNTNDVAGTMINTLTISDPNMASIPKTNMPSNTNIPSSINFNAATDSDNSNVTGGRYTYSPGRGWYDDVGDHDGSSYDYLVYGSGSYDYVDGGINNNQVDIEWSAFYDPLQNTYPGNEAKCAALSLAYCDNPLSQY